MVETVLPTARAVAASHMPVVAVEGQPLLEHEALAAVAAAAMPGQLVATMSARRAQTDWVAAVVEHLLWGRVMLRAVMVAAASSSCATQHE